MTIGPQPPLSKVLSQIVADAWAFRWQVEREAQIRFSRLGLQLAEAGISSVIVEMARRASDDERRHAVLCRELATTYGHSGSEHPVSDADIAPSSLGEREKLLYELVAACCITETESMSVLTTLLRSAQGARMRAVLREIARDEVNHSRLGWAFLAHEHRQMDLQFLGPLIPYMLEGTVAEGLFAPAAKDLEDPRLLHHGVLTHTSKRLIFTQTLLEVVFPGLQTFGVDATPGMAWLEQKRSALVGSPNG